MKNKNEGGRRMYCYVIFGENNEKKPKYYLYEYNGTVESGEVVVVPTKETLKIALVRYIFKEIPDDIEIESDKIKKIISKNQNSVDAKLARSFLLAMIDEYKEGVTRKEDLCGIMETFVSTNEIDMDSDEILNQILTIQLPDACLYYVDEPGEEQKRELGFWKELKDIEYKLRYGYSFWKKQESRKSKIKEDPVEYTDEYLRVELELERLIRSEIGEEKYLGFCHKYWSTKKNILKNKFEIGWKRPAELNRTIRFD